MYLLLLLWISLQPQAEIPLKPTEEFKIELEYKFKSRPAADNSFIDVTETVAERERRTSTTPLPYLIIHLSFQKLSDKEVRIRCTDNDQRQRLTKKVDTVKVYALDLGFTEDMKDRVTPHEYVFVLMDSDRNDTSRIHLIVEEDGTFLINGVKKGKF